MEEKRQSIFKKAKKEDQYAQISNDLINNRNLSYKALGIACYILSKPDDWEVYISDLCRDRDAERSVRSGIKELIEHKYMQRYRVYDKETGKVHHWETLVSEEPFDEQQMISNVKETYLKDDEGKIRYKKIIIKDYERLIPIVLEREVVLDCQNSKVEKNNGNFLDCQNVHVENLHVENAGQQILNNTNTNSITNTKSSNSNSKGESIDSFSSLIELFNKEIAELNKVNTKKVMKYIEKYGEDFVKAIIIYCKEHDAQKFEYFDKTIKAYIKKDITTVADLELSITNFQNENKEKKDRSMKEKRKKKAAKEFEKYIDEKEFEDMTTIETIYDFTPNSLSEEIHDVKENLKNRFSEASYNAFIKFIDIYDEDDRIVIQCPNGLVKQNIEERCMLNIKQELKENGYNKKIVLAV